MNLHKTTKYTLSESELKDAIAKYLTEKLDRKPSTNDISLSASVNNNDEAYDFKATYTLIETSKA